jgi:hypothetical protein
MEPNKFYVHVSSWIKSYRDADALHWLRKFINQSGQPYEIKEKLHAEIDGKIAGLKHRPHFAPTNGDHILADEQGHPKVFTTRYSAVCKVAELKMKGYEVELKPGSAFYRIKLTKSAPVEEFLINSLQ